MEAVIAIIRNLLQNTRTALIVGVVLGVILGLIIGWGLWPVQWTDGTPISRKIICAWQSNPIAARMISTLRLTAGITWAKLPYQLWSASRQTPGGWTRLRC